MLRFPNLLFCGLLAASALQADVKLPKIFSSHMVLQRDLPIHVWGWADPGEAVAVKLGSAEQSATADRIGGWSVYLPPMPASAKPQSVTIKGHNTIALEDVLLGDIWFASGQSNMEMPLLGFPGNAVIKDSEQEIKNASHPEIRLLIVAKHPSSYPLRDFDSVSPWVASSPETAAKFSAVAYFFGREINSREHVPIGLIDSTWGGTPAEAWVSMASLSSDSALMPVFQSWAEMTDEQADISARRDAEKRETEAARKANQPLPKFGWHPDPASWAPSWLYNGMVAPAVGLGIKGVIWYQGESNSVLSRAPLYSKLFPSLIADWRRQWNQGDFPFLFVQISSFTSTPKENWPIIREAQRRTLTVANTGMAVTVDVGDPENVHPADKQTVGNRLALAARALAYNEKVEYRGPVFRNVSVNGNAIQAWFMDQSSSLVAKDSKLSGFEIAGADGQYHSAEGRLEGCSVVLTSPSVTEPKSVRYLWKNDPVPSLFDSNGLPASPFTSEEDIPRP